MKSLFLCLFFSLCLSNPLEEPAVSQLFHMIGCWKQPDQTCFDLPNVYLQNQAFILIPPIPFVLPSFWNYLSADVFARVPNLPPCFPALKLLTIEWFVPVRDDGPGTPHLF